MPKTNAERQAEYRKRRSNTVQHRADDLQTMMHHAWFASRKFELDHPKADCGNWLDYYAYTLASLQDSLNADHRASDQKASCLRCIEHIQAQLPTWREFYEAHPHLS